MSTLNISLPDSMCSFIDEQIARGGYSTASEYVRRLIREDQKQKAQEQLEALLLEGLQSEASEMTPEDWAEIRQQVRERHAKRQRK